MKDRFALTLTELVKHQVELVACIEELLHLRVRDNSTDQTGELRQHLERFHADVTAMRAILEANREMNPGTRHDE